MTDLPPRSDELTSLLTRARADGPAPARLARVRARLEGQLGPLGVATPAPPAGLEPASSTASAPSTAGSAQGSSLGLLSLPTLALALVFAGRILLAPIPSVPGPAPLAPSDPAPPQIAPSELAPSELAPPPAPSRIVAEPSDEPAAAEAPVASHPVLEGPSAPVRPRTAPRAEPPPPVPDEAAAGSTLRDELVLLERAMARRREGDLEGARAAIAEHARRFPQGIMSPERQRLAAELDATP